MIHKHKNLTFCFKFTVIVKYNRFFLHYVMRLQFVVAEVGVGKNELNL